MVKEMGSLLDFALLQLLCLLKSEQSRFERVWKMVYRSAKSSHDPAPERESSAAGQDTPEAHVAIGRYTLAHGLGFDS